MEKNEKIINDERRKIKVTDYVRKSLNKVAAAQGFVNYDLNFNYGSSTGDGFCGLIFKVTIQEKNSDKNLKLIIKSPPENARSSDMNILIAFERENILYNEVLPTFVKFQEEKRIDMSMGFFNFPKCYFSEYNEDRDEAIVVMEDLREFGYDLWDKSLPVDFEHSKLVVTALGKLHALSFALKAQKPEVFEKFKKLNDLMFELMFSKENSIIMMQGNVERAAATLPEGDVEGKARVLKLNEDIAKLVKYVMDPAEPYSVVSHGDCWSSNFMYHYDNKSPDKVVLLDWQISRYCSPVIDLVYFIFMCTGGEMRAKHFEELIDIYHDSLSEFLKALGGDATTQFPKSVLKEHIKNYARFGVMLATMAVPILTTPKEELPDPGFMAENMTNNPELMKEMFEKFTKTNKAYAERMRAVLEDAIRYGFL